MEKLIQKEYLIWYMIEIIQSSPNLSKVILKSEQMSAFLFIYSFIFLIVFENQPLIVKFQVELKKENFLSFFFKKNMKNISEFFLILYINLNYIYKNKLFNF